MARCRPRSATPGATPGTRAPATPPLVVELSGVTLPVSRNAPKEPSTLAAAGSATPPPEPAVAVRTSSARCASTLRGAPDRTQRRSTGTRATLCPNGAARAPPGSTALARPAPTPGARPAACTHAATFRLRTTVVGPIVTTLDQPVPTTSATTRGAPHAALTGAPNGRTDAARPKGIGASALAETIDAIATLDATTSTTPLVAPQPISRAAPSLRTAPTRQTPRRNASGLSPPEDAPSRGPPPGLTPTTEIAPPAF